MIHADYYEPKAQMLRAEERRHLAHKCDECWETQVCPDAVGLDDDYRECRFAGCLGGTRMPDADGSYYILLCGMCY